MCCYPYENTRPSVIPTFTMIVVRRLVRLTAFAARLRDQLAGWRAGCTVASGKRSYVGNRVVLHSSAARDARLRLIGVVAFGCHAKAFACFVPFNSLDAAGRRSVRIVAFASAEKSTNRTKQRGDERCLVVGQ